jgi:hypothetical protein
MACHIRAPKLHVFADLDSEWCTVWCHRECDSPLALTNFTLDFLDKKWSSELDFVICSKYILSALFFSERVSKTGTGDNAR